MLPDCHQPSKPIVVLPRMLTAQDATEILQQTVTTWTLKNAVKSGVIEGGRVGQKTVLDGRSLAKFLRAHGLNVVCEADEACQT